MDHAQPQTTSGTPPTARLRTLFGKLRDLDLRVGRIAVATGLEVVLEGCASLDDSAGRPLRYRLRSCRGDAHLELRLVDGMIELERQDDQGEVLGSRRVELAGGAEGPVTAASIQARIDPDAADARETERFLRRIVRAAFV
ncbi:hypothetical protein [Engelhardtia mirabilis]|uniref:Uncharacterized protein n=1 Tax=Engelhardtia mirabilis TaxID=2528011 RepID=A0A518BS32_9BACT|nr:hypothetical protein Pla133_49010 [Planctomycetes bacterium Pla133]QDV04105.1 hypothetical protein Pla86_48990 [Planctomycetes bacterium Pla86]